MNAAKRLGLALLGALLAAALLAAACSTPGGRTAALGPAGVHLVDGGHLTDGGRLTGGGSAVDAGSPSRFEISVARP
ncbi:hypothetical protein ACFVHW_05350 [Streptomyces sp. NPDC127110]|uniref:hypothetical protein n=1 Tax=Streptomyces sp. NPDC127110 TaxID=3345362 RepID=UPI00362D79DA